MNTFELRNPIKINGELRNSFKYDFNELTEEHLLDAIAQAHFNEETFSAALETDYSFHLWLLYQAIINQNQEVDVTDLQRMKGCDPLNAISLVNKFLNSTDVDEQSVTLSIGVLSIDKNAITADMYSKADALSRNYANKLQKPSLQYMGLDYAFHLFIGYYLLSASNKDVTIEELRNLKGGDLLKIMRVGRNFILSALAEEYSETGSQESESENSLEVTRESTTQE